MIVTFTANPCIDRTLRLDATLRRGEFHRAAECTDQMSGKGVNVANVLAAAGVRTTAVVAFADQTYLGIGREAGGVEPLVALLRPGLAVRTNIAITEPDGTTTKVNEPGPTLDAEDVAMTTEGLAHIARQVKAAWVVLSGSLPPGAPVDWYAQIVAALQPVGCRVAVDTSEGPLLAVLDQLDVAPVALLKPNVDEVAQALGMDAEELQALADGGEFSEIVAGASELCERGAEAVLVTLGAAGALLVTADGAWQADALDVEVRSTVGAGDSALAGYLIASARGAGPDECLATAVAYGSATAANPGTALGQASEEQIAAVTVRQL